MLKEPESNDTTIADSDAEAILMVINTEHNCANDSTWPLCVANYYFRLDETRSLAVAIPLAVVVVTTIVIHFLTIAAVLFAHKVPLITKLLLTHLFASCFVFSLLTVPLAIGVDMFDGRWTFGSRLCWTYEALNVMLPAVILYGLTIIAVDQRMALNKLMTHGKPQNAWDALKRCATVWLVGTIAGVSANLGWRTWYAVEVDDTCSFKDDHGFVIFRVIAGFLTPGGILAIFIYSFNLKSIAEGRKIRVKYHDAKMIDVEVCSGLHMKVSEPDPNNKPSSAPADQNSFKYLDDELLGADDRVKKQKILWSKLKIESQITQALKMVSIITFSCYIPLYVCVITASFCSGIPFVVVRISLWLVYSTAITIPSVYLIMVPRVQRAFFRLLPFCRCFFAGVCKKCNNKTTNDETGDTKTPVAGGAVLDPRQNRAKTESNAKNNNNKDSPFKFLRNILRGQLSPSNHQTNEPGEMSPISLSPVKTNSDNNNNITTSVVTRQFITSHQQTAGNNNQKIAVNVELTLDDLVVKRDLVMKKSKVMLPKAASSSTKKSHHLSIATSERSFDSSISSISTPSSTLTL